MAPSILQKLINENVMKKLSDLEILRIITHEFLLSTKIEKSDRKFVHSSDNLYALKDQADNVYYF